MAKIGKLIFLIVASIFAMGYSSSAQNLTLDSCRNMALRHNKISQISSETLLAAQEARKAAFTAYLPSFNAVGAYTYNSKDISILGNDALLPVGSVGADGNFTYTAGDIVTITLPNGTVVPVNAQGKPTSKPEEFIPKHVAYLPKDALTFDMQNIFAGGINFTQPIFMGGKITALYNMAKSAEKIASVSGNNNDVNVMIQVDEAYWRVVSLQCKTRLATEYNSLLQTTYNNVKAMYDEGVFTSSDLLKVKVKLGESQMSLTKAKNGLKLSKMLLNQICGMDYGTDYTLEDIGEVQGLESNLGDSIKSSVAQRSEAVILEENVNIARQQLNIARSRFFPNIVATGGYMFSNPNLYNGFDKSFSGMFTVGVGVTIPIFHFGERVHTLNMAKYNLKIAELTRDESLEKMELQANMKQNSKNEAIEQMDIANNNMLQAEENLRQSQEGFEQGVISTSDLMQAQTAWVSAKSEVIDARINLKLTELYLNQSLGRVKVNKPSNK